MLRKNYIKILFLIILIVFIDTMLPSYSIDNYSYSENNSSEINMDYNEDILFIVDFSSSMKEKIGSKTKIELSLNAVKNIISKTNYNTKIGLRIFGITNKPIYDYTGGGKKFIRENICTASDLVLPIAKHNSISILNNISTFTPRGASPIEYSLKQAIQNDFNPLSQNKHIILITDGGENCNGHPCEYIKRIMQLRNDIRIDVIGISITKSNDYSELSCIANYGKGNFYRVDTPVDFDIKINEALKTNNFQFKELDNIQLKQLDNFQKKLFNNDSIKYKNYSIDIYK